MDAEAYRAESRERWERAAEHWGRTADLFAEVTRPVSEWMVAQLHPQPGQTIVDLAAGTGDTGFLAADAVRPGGRVLITDGAEAMIEVARARGKALGIENAEFRTMELEWIDLSAATVDGITCRWGVMLLADPEAALQEIRRILRPGGRFALAAWDEPARNPWLTEVNRVLVELGHTQPPEPGLPGPFAFSRPGHIEELLLNAGFEDVVVDAVDFDVTAKDLDDWWETMSRMANELRRLLGGFTPAEHYAVRDAVDAAYARFVQDDGSLRVPARTLVAAAGA